MTKSTGRGGFEVFDFDEEEELVQKESARIMKRFPKPVVDASPVTKYTFLERFAVKETTPHQKRNVVVPIVSDSSVSQKSKTGQTGCIDIHSSGCNSWPGSRHPREETPSSRPSGCIVDKDEGENTGDDLLSASTSTSTKSKSSCEQSMESDVRSWISDTVNKKVVVSPDSIMHEKIYCTDSILTFTPNTVKLVGSFVDKNKETFSLEWPVTIILKIESQWCQDVETAVIKIYLRSEDTATVIEDGLSGVTLLKFTICDSSWFQGEEAIKLLDAKYKALWNVIYDIDSVREDNELLETNSLLKMENYLTGEASDVLVFPKGEHDAVSIGPKDMELLQPETFINDTIIDFYMKYLMTQIPHKERNRFYFFNSFFFRKLADLDKGSNNKSERQEAFQRVQKWTRNVNLFEKDYIFIPVNFSLHWSLIIICHPGELINIEDYAIDESSKCTRILHMDSLRGCHRGLKNLFESYLKEELRVRRSLTTEVMALKVSNIQFVSLEVPQQQNSFDCGLFLLHYVERFLQHAFFSSFSPHTRINRDWFPPSEVSCKRSCIRELIHKLLLNDSDDKKEGEHDHGNPQSSTVSPDSDLNQTKSGTIIEETCSSADTSGTNYTEHDLISSTKPDNSCATSGFVTTELPENLRRAVSKFCSEVAEKFSDRIASYPNRDSRILSGKANEPSTSYSSKFINSLRTSWNTGMSRLQGMNNDRNMEVHDDRLDQPTADLNKKLNTVKSCSTSVEDLENCVVQDSEDEAVHAVRCGNSSRAIGPFPSCSERTSLVDCVVQDSESDDELKPEPNIYEEKDVIDIEDSSKSFKIIDLSNEADDDNPKPPSKRPRLKLDR